MVPIQTFLILLGALVMLSSCSQKLPPHPGNDALALQSESDSPLNHRDPNPNAIIKPDGPGTDTVVSLLPSQLTLNLSGPNAAKLYQLLAIVPAVVSGDSAKVKQGVQFSCRQGDVLSDCTILIAFPNGEVKKEIDAGAVQKAAPEITQTPSSDGTILIYGSEKGPKAVISIFGEDAKTIFNNLVVSHERNLDLLPDATHALGVHRAAESVNCTQEANAATPTNYYYSCYLHLDLSNGSIDRVDPNDLD